MNTLNFTTIRLLSGFKGALATLCCTALLGNNLAAQEVPIIDFSKLEKRLKANNDTVMLFNFWATWCKPCIEELPYFEKLHETYQGSKVKVILVNLDFKSQYEKKLLPFVRKNDIKSEVVMLDAPDYNAWIDKVSTDWSGAIPATVLVHGKSGTYNFYEKSFNYQQLEQIIKPLLN